MNIKEVIKSQYHASFEMLKQVIIKCPAPLWVDPAHKNQFWHIAYHTLFYTHLYLQPSEKDFTPWVRHKEQAEFMGPLPWPPHAEPKRSEPYSQTDILEYLELCRKQVEERVTSLNLEDQSGFEWLPMNKLELQFYNIRHLQQHTGELCERLEATANLEVDWVGMWP